MNKKKKWLFFLKLYPVLILSTILFMCIGYAATGEINLSITGNAFAQMKKEVYITESIYQNDINAYKNESSLKSISSTVLNSKIKLSETDSNSQITYKVTLYNNNDYDVEFDNITFDNGFYDNQNIIFELSDNLTQNTTLKSKSYTTFQITFKYKDGFTPSNTTNQLNAYLNINIKLKEHTVTLVYNDGVTPDGKIKTTTSADLPVPSREGYTFGGWYLPTEEITNIQLSLSNPYYIAGYEYWTQDENGAWVSPRAGDAEQTDSKLRSEAFTCADGITLSFDWTNISYIGTYEYTYTSPFGGGTKTLTINETVGFKIYDIINNQYVDEVILEVKDGGHEEYTLSAGTWYIDFYTANSNTEYAPVPLPEIKLENVTVSGTQVIPSDTKVPDVITEDITVVADWLSGVYTVIYNPNGATSVSEKAEIHVLNVPKNLAVNNFYRYAYTFTGWNTKADGSGASYEDKASVCNLAADGATVTLYAQWTPIEYSITYNLNGGTGVSDSKYTIESDTITLPIPSKNENVFKGWYTSSDLSGSAVTQIAKGSTGHKIFYAKWEPETIYLYNKGNQNTSLTGGWTTAAWDGGGDGDGSTTYESTAISINVYNNSSGGIQIQGAVTNNKIDLTGVKTIYATVNMTTAASESYHQPNNVLGIAVMDTNQFSWSGTTGTPGNVVSYRTINTAGSYTLALDVSMLMGTYYVAIYGHANSRQVAGTFSEVRIE